MITIVIRRLRPISEEGLDKFHNPHHAHPHVFEVLGQRRFPHLDLSDVTSGSIKMKEETKRAILEACRDEGLVSESFQVSVIGRTRGVRGFCSLFTGEYRSGILVDFKRTKQRPIAETKNSRQPRQPGVRVLRDPSKSKKPIR